MLDMLTGHIRKFQNLTASDEALIRAASTDRVLQEGELLLEEGSIARELFFISQGILKIGNINTKGNEVTLFFLKEGQFCTILNSFNNEVPAHESIRAACAAEVLAFSKPRLLTLYAQLPYLEELFRGMMQQTLIDKTMLRNAYMGEDASTRYQKFLQRQPDIARRVSLTDIASYLQVTPQSLSRIRRQQR